MVMVTAMRRKCPLMPREVHFLAVKSRGVLHLSVLMSLVVFSPPVRSQSTWMETSVSASETFTDNVDANKNGHSDWITEVTPSVSLHRASGHITGRFDASLRNVVFANEGSKNDSFIALNGRGTMEVIDDSLFIDVRSAIGRNNLSSFRGRAQWDTLNTEHQSEVRYLSVSPRWVGHIGRGDTQFSMSYDGEALSYGSGMNNQRNGTFRARLFDPTAGERFGWSLDYKNSGNSYQDHGQSKVEDTSLTGTLIFHVTRQFSLRAIAGTEKNNYMTGKDDSGTVTGYGLNWQPTPRTTVDGLFENHVYGDTYDVKFSHRRPLSAWQVSVTRKISSAYQTAPSNVDSYYYDLFSSALLSEIPDPAERDQAVRELLKDLGISSATSFGNFATNAFFVDRRIQAGVSLIGARHTLAFAVYHSEKEKTNGDQVTNPNDDFANNDNIESEGVSVSFSHSLTPKSGINAALHWSRSEGTGGGAAQSRRTSGINLGYSTQLGHKTFGAVGLRRQTSSGSDEFTENSVNALLSVSF